jgi:hypothetical protein
MAKYMALGWIMANILPSEEHDGIRTTSRQEAIGAPDRFHEPLVRDARSLRRIGVWATNHADDDVGSGRWWFLTVMSRYNAPARELRNPPPLRAVQPSAERLA